MIYVPGWQSSLVWTVVLGFIMAFFLGFGMGANDCANAYGTSVGAGVLKLWQAYLLATVFEVAGAALLGYKVTDTIRKGIVDLDVFNVYSVTGFNSSIYCEADSCQSNSSCLFWNSTLNVTDDDLNCTRYTGAPYIMAALGTLVGCAAWLMLATIFKMPVSTTHSTIGATIGSALVVKGSHVIYWKQLGKVVASWIISPVLSGLFSTIIYAVIKFFALNAKDPLKSSLHLVPVLLAFTIFINVFSIMYHGSKYLHFDKLYWWIDVIVAIVLAVVISVAVHFLAGKRIERMALKRTEDYEKAKQLMELKQMKQRKDSNGAIAEERASDTDRSSSLSTNRIAPSNQPHPASMDLPEKVNDLEQQSHSDSSFKQKMKDLIRPMDEPVAASMVFTALQILSSIFLSFSHGSNDTANAVAPLLGLWITYKTGYALSGSQEAVSEGLIVYGALSMIVGLWILGHKVIETVGHDITEMTPARGFSMETGTAFTVLFCSKLGIPVSTTHCIIGAIVGVGWFRARTGVSWKLFGGMAIAWVVTLPVAGAISALITWLLLFALK